MRTATAISLIFLAVHLRAEPASTPPILRGIINLPDMKVAVLEVAKGAFSEIILKEGQREGDLQVLKLQLDEGRAKVQWKNDEPIWLELGSRKNSTSRAAGIDLENAGLSSLLYVYSHCLKRTVLQHPLLPRETRFTLTAQAGGLDEAKRILEIALAEKLMVTIPDGDKFVMLVPKSEVSQAKPHAPKVNLPASRQEQTVAHDTSKNEIIPAGMIDLRGLDPSQAFTVYADLIRKTVDRSQPLPWRDNHSLFCTTVTPISREEATYVLETLLRWSGIAAVPGVEGFIKAVPVTQKK